MTDFERLRGARPEGHPAAVELEEAAFGPEPTPGTPMAQHLAGCERCRHELVRLREERRAFLQARPPKAFTARVLERGAARSSRWRLWPLPWPAWVLATATAASVVIAVATVGLLREEVPRGDGITLKGELPLELELLVSRDGGAAAPWRPGRPLREGDVLRFHVSAPEAGHFFVASLDGAGRFSRYYPAEGERSAAIQQGRHVLPGSVVLDDAQGDERVFGVWSPGPLASAEVERAVRALPVTAPVGRVTDGDTVGLPGARVVSLRVPKERR